MAVPTATSSSPQLHLAAGHRERERHFSLISLYLLICKDFFWSYHHKQNTYREFIIHGESKDCVLGVPQFLSSLLFQLIADFSKLITKGGCRQNLGF